jgi:glycosyltransferase involved in cell wall biosynthesis
VKILILNNEFPPLGGGTGVVNLHILKELSKNEDLEIDLVTSSRSKSDYKTEKFSEHITIHKVPVDNQNIHHATCWELLRYTFRGLRKSIDLQKRKNFDVCLAFSAAPAGGIAFVLKKFLGLPYIVSLQGPDIPGFEVRYKYLYPFLKPILSIIWDTADKVVAISAQQKQLAQDFKKDIEILVVPNGVDPEEFHPIIKDNTEIKILCVGRLIKRKGMDHLIEAFKRVQDSEPNKQLSLVIAGTGDEEASLKDLARALDLSDSVHFLGFVDRSEMPRVYQDADVFCLPSEHEGMSIALLEAISTQLPIIFSNTGGADELIEHEKNGLLFDYGDVETLAAHLARLCSDAALRESMSKENEKRRMEFSWAAITNHWLQLFNDVKRN